MELGKLREARVESKFWLILFQKWKKQIITDITEIKGIVRNYYEQLYAKKLDNMGEMDKFLEIYNLPKVKQEETENLKRLITMNEIEGVTIKLPADGFTGEFYQLFKEELSLILLNLFQKFKRREDFQALFMRPVLS